MEVIERVAELFAGHHQLLSGFNQFLPRGYRLEPSDDPSQSNEVIIITPEGRRQCRNVSAIAIDPGAH
jgi:histone deacetylase complex regulatory component SIN3